MAIDEAILQTIGAGDAPATLRFYRWDEPTISLGYFQKYHEFAQQDAVIGNLALVRRQTGGGAILHDDELTYSLALPVSDDGETDIEAMYKLVHDACIATLAQMGVQAIYRRSEDSSNSQRGPFFCFARTHRLDLVIGGEKLLGSAQRRIKNAVLQHGSLIIGRHFQQQPSAALNDRLPGEFDSDSFINSMATAISSALQLTLINGDLTDAEASKLPALRAKYAGDEWTKQR